MPIPFIAEDDEQTPFPAVRDALHEPNGLLMAGGSLSQARLLSAYSQGIFPWYDDDDPILWWSPDPRCVIHSEKIHISKSLGKTLRSSRYEVTENESFRTVMQQCAAPRAESRGTWVTNAMIEAYCALHESGLAQSIEVWREQKLVGGLYGIVLGRVFVGESMFSRERDTSKIALAHLARCGHYDLIDCQLETDHLKSLGADTIQRQEYIELLTNYGQLERYSVNAEGGINIEPNADELLHRGDLHG